MSGARERSLQELQQIAEAAGHGHGHRGIGHQPDPWFSLDDNCRPSYDLLFIRTFTPRFTRELVDRLASAEWERDALREEMVALLDAVTAAKFGAVRRNPSVVALYDTADRLRAAPSSSQGEAER
jgi:hypothetical protein